MDSILSQTTSEIDARLVKAIGNPETAGFTLIRTWPWVAAEAAVGDTVAELITALNSSSALIVDPLANGKEYTGSFVQSSVMADDENTRGTTQRNPAIYQTLTKIKVVTDVSSLGTPLKDADYNRLNAFGLDTLNSHITAGDDHRIFHWYLHLDPSSRTTAMSLTPTESGYTIVHRDFKISKEDNTATLLVLFEKIDWFNTVPVEERLGRANVGGYGERKVTLATGIQAEDNLVDLVDAESADDDYVLTSLQGSQRAKGEGVISKVQTAVNDGVPTQTIETKAVGNSPASKTNIWYRVAPDKITEVYTAADTYDVGDGYLLLWRRKNIAPDGSATIMNKVIIPNSITFFSIEVGQDYDGVKTYMEKTASKPVTEYASGDLSDFPAENYYWRLVKEYFTEKWSTSELAIKLFVNDEDAMVGSFSVYVGRGSFKGHKVTKRIYFNWKDSSLQTAFGENNDEEADGMFVTSETGA